MNIKLCAKTARRAIRYQWFDVSRDAQKKTAA
jgi:hypothetical protein